MSIFQVKYTPTGGNRLRMAARRTIYRLRSRLLLPTMKQAMLLATAVKRFEGHTKRSLMSRQLRLVTTGAGCEIELPGPPVASLDLIEARDDKDDPWVAVDSADYEIELERTPPLIELEDWYTYLKVEYTAGVTDREDISEDWKSAILMLATFYYENRGDVMAEMSIALKGLLDELRTGTAAGYWYV